MLPESHLPQILGAAIAVSRLDGGDVFERLCANLARILGVDVAFIAVYAEGDRSQLSMLAFHLDGKPRRPFSYAIEGTPCAGVAGGEFRFLEQGARGRFPKSDMLAKLGVESYAAYPLADSTGQTLGLIGAMHRGALGNAELAEAVLKIFAMRAAGELERARSEASYRAIFEASEDSIFVHDWDSGAVVEASNHALDRHDYEERAAALIGQVKAQGAPVRFEWRGRRRDGRLTWHDVTLKPATIAGRRRILAFVRDVTERKSAEEALRASEEQYRAIFNASADALVLWNSELRRVDINPAYERIFGYTREEILGSRYREDLPDGYVARRLELVRRTLAGESCVADLESVRKDGERIQIEVRTIPVQHRGTPHVLAVCRDVTARRRAEAAMRASEEQYRAIFNASVDGMVLWDGAHRIVDVNEAFLRMHGHRRDEMLGSAQPDFIPAELREQCATLLPRILQGEPCHLQARSRRQDGAEFDVEIHGIPMQYRGEPHVLILLRDITSRREADEKLRASESQYRAIFNASADSLVLRDADFRVVDVNPAYEAMSGRPRAEALGRTGLTMSPPELNQHVKGLHARAIAGEKVMFEARASRKNGERFDIETRGVPILHQGRPHVLYIGRDITARKSAEQALRASEEQYRSIFNATADALVLRDAQFRVVDVNPAYERMSGFRRDEVIGADRVLANPPEMDEPIKALHRRALAGEPVMLETVFRRKNGALADLELRGVPIRHRGEPHVLYIGRDISERKLSEQALRSSEEQYRAIFNSTTDALVLRDAEFRVVDVNPAFCEMTGYVRQQVLAARHTTANPPGLDATLRELHRRALEGAPAHAEIDGMRVDGKRFDLEVRAVRTGYQGRPHVLYIGRDISERKALESRLRQAQKMEALGQLTGGIAHDFNNLLASIMGYVVLAAERDAAAADPKLGSHLEQALASCRRARDLIQQMLTFSRGQRGMPRAVALAPAVSDSLKLLRSSLPSTLEIATELEAAAATVMLDPVQLDQILLNLSINARDATAGVGRVEVAVRPAALVSKATCASCRKRFKGDFVELSVGDSGSGIPPQVLERMFEPFFTTKDVGRGSGMGLATVHGIVHEHRGHLLVETAAGRGSRFRILFPAHAGGPAAAARGGQQRPSRRREALSGRVLVVDDEVSVADFMRELLESWGLAATAVTSPLGVMERVSRHPEAYDLVILDQTMPGMTGINLARELAAARPELPILLYTGHSERIDRAELESAGVRALLHKPVEPEELYRLLRAHLPGASRAGRAAPTEGAARR